MTWKMSSDSMMVPDEKDPDRTKIVVVKHQIKPSYISQIRIFQDWYFDVSAGKFHSEIKCIDLVREIYSPMGELLGYALYCRIYY